jgi:uncharacterized protein YjiS (DUF1127 family)
MNRTETRLDIPQHALPLAVCLRSLASALEGRQAVARLKKATAGLSADQLKDIGLDAQPDPRLAVKASLMTGLISMR